MNKKWTYSVVGLLLMTALSGCATSGTDQQNGQKTQNAARPNTAATQNASPNQMHQNANRGNVNQQQGATYGNQFDRTVADRMVKAAADVPGVAASTAVVYGNDAVIGIQTRFGPNQRQQRQVTEQKVQAAARQIAPQMNIRVTSDDTMYGRIQGLSSTVTQGLTQAGQAVTSGPNTAWPNLNNAASDFTVLIRDLGRAVTAPFR